MAEFERPRALALSDAELARALQTFPSDASGLEQAAKLMAEQQKLREQDSQELQAWIELLKARDDQQSRQILSESIAKIFPAEPLVIEHIEEPAVLTSQLPIITRRGKISNRIRNGQILRLLSTILLLAVSNALVLDWLAITGLGALLASFIGLSVAFLIAVPLKRHLLHPVLRAAAVFGGAGVYLFAGLILGATSLAYVVAFNGHSSLVALADVGPYSAVLVIVVAGACLLGQLVPVRFGALAIALPTLAASFFLFSDKWRLPLETGLEPGWHWGAVSIALLSSLVLILGTPHTQISLLRTTWLVPGTTLAIAVFALAVPYSTDLALALAVAGLMLGLVFAGRDLAGGALGRLAGLAMLIGLALSPFADLLSGSAISLIACAIVLILLDQLARKSALHIASLDTSYGFYGSFTFTSWVALTLAAASGTPFLTGLLPDTFNHLEWSLIAGLLIGAVFGLLRLPIIKRQDREIKNLDSTSGNLENLLGL